jgi:hypothetical protein
LSIPQTRSSDFYPNCLEKGLYAKEFARAAEFPKANLSHAYSSSIANSRKA